MKLFSPARIHLGFLEMNQSLPRFFGSLGLTISKYGFEIEIKSSDKFKVVSPDSNLKKKVLSILLKFQKKMKIQFCEIKVNKFIPQHIGLGSGTQLSLSVGYLVSLFFDLKMTIDEIAVFLKRGKRSGIGIQSFKRGGFAVDLGKKKKSTGTPLELINLKWPDEWKIILIFQNKKEGVSGNSEIFEFKKVDLLPIKKNNCSELLLKVIPGIMEKDFKTFCQGIQLIQENMSETFYGDKRIFASKKIRQLSKNILKNKICGYGQTSWGPTSFIFCENSKKRNELLKSLEKYINLKNLDEINFVKVEGRNKGKILLKGTK